MVILVLAVLALMMLLVIFLKRQPKEPIRIRFPGLGPLLKKIKSIDAQKVFNVRIVEYQPSDNQIATLAVTYGQKIERQPGISTIEVVIIPDKDDPVPSREEIDRLCTQFY